ncbi:MAG: glycosyltransferase family 1 protein [Limosilactobacillus sp.]
MQKGKIKIAIITTNLEMTGISSVIMNYVSYLDKRKYDLTVIAGERINKSYIEQCKKNNVQLIRLPNKRKHIWQYYFLLYKTIIKNKYDIFHVNGSSSTLGIDLLIAKLAGVKIRIAHSHNTTTENLRIHKLLKPLFNSMYTNALACGTEAGKWLFGNESFTVIPNGFEINNFKFNMEIRREMRAKLGIPDDVEVIGHIGRFNFQKNHEFILRIFSAYLKLNPNSVLLLIGNGPDFNKIKEKVGKSKFKNKIILYGETSNPNYMYMAMDKFIFPSRFEGLPVTLLEAQISGLPAVISDVITNEVVLSKNVKSESLSSSAVEWAKDLLSLPKENREEFFNNYLKKFKNYEITNNIQKLSNVYDKAYLQRVANKGTRKE